MSAGEIRKAIAKLERRIADVSTFDPSMVTKRFNNPEVDALEASIAEALQQAFGHDTVEYRRYSGAARLDNGAISMDPGPWVGRGGYDPDHREDGIRYLTEGKERALTLLRAAVRSLIEELADMGAAEEDTATVPAADRRVRVDHNRQPYSEMVAALDRLTQAIEGLNDYPDDELKEQHKAELKAGQELLRPWYARPAAIWAVLATPLRWIAQQFAAKEIGQMADLAWKLVRSYFGF